MIQKKRQPKTIKSRVRKDPEKAVDDPDDLLAEGQEYKKHVEKALREWLQSEGCRCKITDDYFHNPKRTEGEIVKAHTWHLL